MENRKKLLEQAVACIMANWPALEITVENYIGGSLGKEKAKWLIEVTSEFITTDECACSTELQDYLNILMDQEFDTLIEDGSLEEISQQLLIIREEFKKGDIEKLAGLVSTSLQKQKSASFLGAFLPTPEKKEQSMPRTVTNTSSSGSSSSSTNSSLVSNTVDVDDDGWTVVTNKKGH